MADLSNYGVLLGTAVTSGSTYTDIAGLIKLEMPKIKNEAVDATNHKSAWGTKVTGGLVVIEDFKGTFSFVTAAVSTMQTACTSGSMMHFQITYPNSAKWQFDALVTEFQPLEADATSPELLQCEITFSPSGSMVVA